MFKYLIGLIGGQDKPARSPKWAKFRREFLKRNPACAGCGTKTKLEVHHIRPYHLFPNLELDENNCVVLCDQSSGSCHLVLGHLKDWTSWNESVLEDAKIYYQKVQTRPYYRR